MPRRRKSALLREVRDKKTATPIAGVADNEMRTDERLALVAAPCRRGQLLRAESRP